jgi:hypothetical protein
MQTQATVNTGCHAFVIEGIPPDRWSRPGHYFIAVPGGTEFRAWGSWGACCHFYPLTFTEAEIARIEGVAEYGRAA